MNPIKIIKPYDLKKRVSITFKKPSMAKQQFKDECDINFLMAKYQKTGEITHVNNAVPNYGEATSVSFTEAMQIVTQAQQTFADLPAEIRKKFNYDPAQFIDFVQNEENLPEMSRMGLLAKGSTQAQEYEERITQEKIDALAAKKKAPAPSTNPE